MSAQGLNSKCHCQQCRCGTLRGLLTRRLLSRLISLQMLGDKNGGTMPRRLLIVSGLIISGLLAATAQAQQQDNTVGQGIRTAPNNAFWTVHDKYQQECATNCTSQCKERWRKLVAQHKRDNVPQAIFNTPACSR